MKKLFALLTALIVVVALAACGKKTTGAQGTTTAGNGTTTEKSPYADIKVGLITLHGVESTYDNNFIESMKRALSQLGMSESQLEHVSGIEEDNTCYETANQLAQTCNIVFADSFGHEDFMIQAASENPNVTFAHATGTKAHTADLANFSNAFASIYEGRYLAGIAAGMKLNAMIEAGTITAEQAVMGYVGAFPYAEVVSGYTSFYLGAKSVCPTVTMKVRYTSSWYDYDAEYAAAKALIETDNCVLISQHADSMGAPTACEEKSVPNVTYNGSTAEAAPNTYLVSSKIDWAPYFVYLIQQVSKKEAVAKDWVGTIATGSVVLDAVGTCAVEGTQAAIDAAKAQMAAGTLHVFDCTTWTKDGEHLTEYMADVDSDDHFTPDTNVIADGYFKESSFRSAPYFDVRIDGITEINQSNE